MFLVMNKIKSLLPVFILILGTSAISHPGIGIVMDSKGDVFYTDLKHIWKIDTKGTRSVAVSNVHSHEIYLDENDNLFGEHLWYEGEAPNKWGHYVWRRSPQGKVETVIPPTEGFLKNYSFVRDGHDHMFWADRDNACQKIARKNPDGTISKLGDVCLNDIQWMTATADGDVYLIDRHDLVKMDAKGHLERIASNLQERKLTQFTVNDPHLAMGVWTDKKENVYVAIYGARKVKKISPDKKVSVAYETAMWWSPTGGLMAPNGDFWLLEYSQTNEARVERITAAGERTIYSSTE
jgi:hypothetical protein